MAIFPNLRLPLSPLLTAATLMWVALEPHRAHDASTAAGARAPMLTFDERETAANAEEGNGPGRTLQMHNYSLGLTVALD